MNSEQIKKAAALLEKRQEMLALRSRLTTKPSFEMGLYAHSEADDGSMYDAFLVSNELGRGLVNIAINANSEALAEIGVEEFAPGAQLPQENVK